MEVNGQTHLGLVALFNYDKLSLSKLDSIYTKG